MAINEYPLSIDNFKRPKVAKNADAICIFLLRLLLIEKGQIQTHPDMGVGLISRYKYASPNQLRSIENDIENQLSVYLPDYQATKISVALDDKELVVNITINDILYAFKTDSVNGTINLTNLINQ